MTAQQLRAQGDLSSGPSTCMDGSQPSAAPAPSVPLVSLGNPRHIHKNKNMKSLGGKTGRRTVRAQLVRHLTSPEATYPGKIQESKAPASALDFQVEAEEDIRTETNGILQDLLLALSKVRPGL